jgi:large subunit ribosomal protein L3
MSSARCRTWKSSRIDTERQLLLVKGAVPGAKGGDVVVRPAVKG